MEANWMLPAALAIALLGAGSGAGRTTVIGDRWPVANDPSSMYGGGAPLHTIYRAEIGVKEATGRNDGPRVAEYLRYCGLGEGYEWCAAFVSWCHAQAGYTEPRNAWAAALFPPRRAIWTKDSGAKSKDESLFHDPSILDPSGPRAGDIFGIYIASKKRIGHCGFVDEWGGKWCITVEGNVNNAVVRKRRLVKSIYVVARWTE